MLDEIGNYLKAQNLIPAGTYLFKGAMADTVTVNGVQSPADNCICLYNTSGFPPSLTFDDQNIDYPGLQIICRGTNYAESEQRMKAIYKKLCGNTGIAGFLNFIPQQSPFSLGQDDKKRWEFSINFKITKMM